MLLNPRPGSACVALIAALVFSVTAAVAGTVRSGTEPGVAVDSIVLGGTAPLTGAASRYAAVARGAEAYFQYANERGGVYGRRILYRYVDDGDNPANTVTATRQLVQQDNVFAIFNSPGTATNLAVRGELNGGKVPQLFVASGATTWGRDYAQYPYTSGFQPTYRAEGWVYGKYLARTASGSRVAVLFENDDYGKDLLDGLRRGLERSRVKVVAAEAYEVTSIDVASQIAKLRASGADTLVLFATPTFAIQAYQAANRIGWKPKHVVNNAAATASATMQAASFGGRNRLVSGTISIQFLRDPTDPKSRKDPGTVLYRKIMKQYAPGENAGDPLYVYGMAAAWTVVEALKKAGKDLTRASLVATLDTFTAAGNPFLLPGIVVKMAGKDHDPVEQMLLRRWQNGSWRAFGGLWAYPAS